MSTKAIREALGRMETEARSTSEWGTVNLAQRARAEVEAIRNAAAAITKGGDLSDEMMARGLLERIAEES